MKKFILLTIFVFIFMPFVLAGTEITLEKYPLENILLGNFAELIQINENDVLVEYVIEVDIINMESLVRDLELSFYFTKGEDMYFIPEVKEIYVCQPINDSDVQWGHNFDHILLEGCSKTIKHEFLKSNNSWEHTLIISKEDIVSNEPYYTPIYARLIFNYKNFIIKRPDQKIFWQELIVNPQPRWSERYLKTEEDTVINSLLNYKTIRYRLEENKFILKAQDFGDSQVFYNNANEESQKRFYRDIFIIILSFGISLVFGFIFSEKGTSERTKNFWILAGISVIITAFILLIRETNVLPSSIVGLIQEDKTLIPLVLLITFILFLVSAYLAGKSYKKDKPDNNEKEDFRDMIQFAKKEFISTLSSIRKYLDV